MKKVEVEDARLGGASCVAAEASLICKLSLILTNDNLNVNLFHFIRLVRRELRSIYET